MSVELPKDAEGREIPLNTSELFISDGTMVHVLRFEYMFHTYDARDVWFVYIERAPGEHVTLRACDVHLTPPDSWERLEEDLQRIAADTAEWFCMYVGHDKRDTGCHSNCSNCKFFKDNRSCEKQAVLDIVFRIRKLRGEGDA